MKIPYVSYESYEHYLEYSKILAQARKPRDAKNVFYDRIHTGFFEDNDVSSDRDSQKSKTPKLTIEEEPIILAYMDYQCNGQDLYLHPRRYVFMILLKLCPDFCWLLKYNDTGLSINHTTT